MNHIKRKKHLQGVTLIEILLVLVIVSAVIWGSISFLQQRALQTRIDRTAIQMQQILNAGLAYYVINGYWPPAASAPAGPLDCLKGLNPTFSPAPSPLPSCNTIYLPDSLLNNSWGNPYQIANTGSLFYVYSEISSSTASPTPSGSALAVASTIAGILPLSYVTTETATIPPVAGGTIPPCTNTDTSCMVVASVNIPGQSLNNARGVNFAGLYHHGGCVPVPVCPTSSTSPTTLRPQIMIVPVSVSGVNTTNTNDVYPISSFTAYAKGPPNATPPACDGTYATAKPCSPVNAISGATYWRACLQVMTTKGNVGETNLGTGAQEWGSKVTLMAITRCAPSGEPAGSSDSVYSR